MSFLSTEKFLSWAKKFSVKFNKHTTQLGGLYFGKDSDGNWGYKTSETDTITRF